MPNATIGGLLRRAERDEDAAFLFAVFAAALGETLAGVDTALRDTLLRVQFAGQDATYRAAHPGARFEVVEVGGAPVGRVISDAAADAVTVLDLAVTPDRRGQGIGAAVLRAFQDEARAAGVPLRFSVLRSNAGARRLHERLGFVPAGGTETHLHMQWFP